MNITKTKKGIFIAILFIVILSASFFCSGCQKKVATLNEFEAKAEANGWTVGKDSRSGSYNNYIALDGNGQVEFYDCGTAENAKNSYQVDLEKFTKQAKNKNAAITEVSAGNYQKFYSEFDNTMHLIIQLDNTYVFSDAPVAYKEKVDKLINDIGY